jgi:hypothetical protein
MASGPIPIEFSFLFEILGLELKAYLEPLHQPFFVMGFLETGSHQLLAWTGFKQ